MLDWHVREEAEPPPEEVPEEPPDERKRVWWRLALLAGGFAIVVGSLFWWQVSERQERLSSDLHAFVVREERARLSGSQEQADEFVAPNAPFDWKQAYAATFGQPGGTIEVVEVHIQRFDGRCADVEVRLDGHPQWRAYCLVGRAWRRVPRQADSWGEIVAVELPGRVRLVYRERDAPFAEELAASLPAYFRAQALWVAERLGGGLNRRTVRRIEIAPHDGFGPLVSDEGDTIVLNSPLMVPYDGLLSPEAQVRLALAQALLARAGPEPQDAANLPGGERFVRAAHLVAAAHLALNQEEHQRLLAHWRRQLDGTWASPLFAEWTTPDRLRLAEWTALFLAETIYRQHGGEVLAEMTQALVTYSSWDLLFEAFVKKSANVVEQETATLALGDDTAVPDVEAPAAVFSASAPMTTTLVAVRSEEALLVRHPALPHPLLVELPRRVVHHAALEMPVQVGCLGAGTRLTLWPTWKERGYRLRADRVEVYDLRPPGELTPDSPDFLFQSLLEPVPQDTAAFIATFDPRYGYAVAALQKDGQRHILAHGVADSIWMEPLAVNGDELHLKVFFSSEGCDWRWYAAYAPRQGTLSSWSLVPEDAFVVWRPAVEAFLAVRVPPSSTATPQATLITGKGTSTFDLPAGYRYFPAGWRSDTRELLFTVTTTPMPLPSGSPPSPDVRLLALNVDSGTTRWLLLRADSLLPGFVNLVLSPGGRYAAAVTGQGELVVWDLSTGTGRRIPVASPDEAIDGLQWGPSLDRPTLLVRVGVPVPATQGEVRVKRLVLVQAEGHREPIEIFVPGRELNGFSLRSVLCPNGDVLYTVVANWPSNPVRLYRQTPGNEPVELLATDRMVLPLACP